MLFSFVRRFVFTRILRSRYRRLKRVCRRIDRLNVEGGHYADCRYRDRIERRVQRLVGRREALLTRLAYTYFRP